MWGKILHARIRPKMKMTNIELATGLSTSTISSTAIIAHLPRRI